MRDLIGLFGFMPVAVILGFVALLLMIGSNKAEAVAEEATTAAGTATGCGIVMVCSVLAIIAVLAVGAASVATLPHP